MLITPFYKNLLSTLAGAFDLDQEQEIHRKKNITKNNSVADPSCLSRIPDPTFFHPGSRIRTVSIPDPGSRILIKEFKHFNLKKSKKMVSKL
jgi:hypothetical protein